MKISVIVPAYNEEERLTESLPIIKGYFSDFDHEIIVIDDGSSDNTRVVASKHGAILNDKRENRGKGFSIREGVEIAKGDLIFFTDCDLSTPISEFSKLNEYVGEFDVVIGSRAMGSDVKTKWYKKLFGRVANFIISFLLIKNIKDTQCGFKLFKADVAKKLFSKLTIERWGFDFEILFLAQKFKYKIKELAVEWNIDERSKVKLIDYIKTFKELLIVKFNNIRGKYDK